MTQRPIYNEEQKMAFVREKLTEPYEINRALSVFRAASAFEEKWGADLSTVPMVDLNQMINQTCGVRLNSKYTKVSMLREYMHWCVLRNIPGAHELGDVDYTGSAGNIKVQLVRSPAHLQQCMDQVFDPEEERTQDNNYRCFLWMAYGGMSEKTTYDLRVGDVSFEYMEASRDGEVAVLYRQGLPAIRNCVKLQQFVYHNAAYVNGPIERDRVQGDRLLRGIREDQPLLNFRGQLSRKLRQKRDAGIDASMLTYYRVWLAGTFYRIYEGEQAGIAPDFLSVAIEAKHLKGTELNAANLRLDYIRWKSIVQSI